MADIHQANTAALDALTKIVSDETEATRDRIAAAQVILAKHANKCYAGTLPSTDSGS